MFFFYVLMKQYLISTRPSMAQFTIKDTKYKHKCTSCQAKSMIKAEILMNQQHKKIKIK